MTRLTWQEYFEQFIRVRLQNLAASQASGRELIEQLRAIAADYKRFLFNDNSQLKQHGDPWHLSEEARPSKPPST
jgi:hypothetical protein